MTDATSILPPALQPLSEALAALHDLRRRLVQAEAGAASAGTEEAVTTRRAEDHLASGEDASQALAAAVVHRDAHSAATATAAGLRRAIHKAEAALPATAEAARVALHGFETECWNRLDGRWRKAAGAMRALLAEATALAWLRDDGGAKAFNLSRIKLPPSVVDMTGPWSGVGVDLGNAPPAPSDAARQVQEAHALLRQAEAVASRATRREAA